EAARLLVDRNWLDVWPDDKDDRLHVYRFTPSMGGGVYQDRTVFQGEFELFRFAIREDQLELDFPHTSEHLHTRFKIERVDGPEPFDLRLTLDRSLRGPRVYHGRSVEGATTASLEAELARAVEWGVRASRAR
ncbi:MAG: hypothetical protein ACREI7_04720, partial [Myxococcota bacterium]